MLVYSMSVSARVVELANCPVLVLPPGVEGSLDVLPAAEPAAAQRAGPPRPSDAGAFGPAPLSVPDDEIHVGADPPLEREWTGLERKAIPRHLEVAA